MKWHTHEKLLCINKLIKPFWGGFYGGTEQSRPCPPYISICLLGRRAWHSYLPEHMKKKKRKFPGSGVVSDWSKQQFYSDWRKIRFDLPWDCDPCSFKTANVGSQHTLPGFSFSPKLVLVSSHWHPYLNLAAPDLCLNIIIIYCSYT